PPGISAAACTNDQTAIATLSRRAKLAREQQQGSLTDRDDGAVDTRPRKAYGFFSCFLSRSQRTSVARVKNYLASWPLSADSATDARASKAIGGRFYDEVHFSYRSCILQVPGGSIESPLDRRRHAEAQLLSEPFERGEAATPVRDFHS